MKFAALKGELAFAALFAALGLYWIGGSLELPIWSGFAPDSGFLPLVYGVLLTGLSIAVMVMLFVSPVEEVEREPLFKSLLILGGLVVSVSLLGVLGFVIPLFGMMLFYYAYVERLPLLRSIVVAAGTIAFLVLVFEHWLKIPLPLGPWGL
jgi:hypothetical protein